jgi:hypothetical protein
VLPAGVPGGQGPVPHHPDAAERASQHRLLLLVGVCPAPVRRPHSRSIAHITEKKLQARRWCVMHLSRPASWGAGFLPGLTTGASSGGLGGEKSPDSRVALGGITIHQPWGRGTSSFG